MATINGIIGRQREIATMQERYESPSAENVAVYGRRSTDKTKLKGDSVYASQVSGDIKKGDIKTGDIKKGKTSALVL